MLLWSSACFVSPLTAVHVRDHSRSSLVTSGLDWASTVFTFFGSSFWSELKKIVSFSYRKSDISSMRYSYCRRALIV